MSARRPGEPDQVATLYVALAEAPGAGEEVAGMRTAVGWLQMVCTTRTALDVMLASCQAIADSTGEVVRVVRFERAGLVGEFRPGRGGATDGP